MTADTLPKLLAGNAAEHGAETAMREKRFGIWTALSWADVQSRTREMALGLDAMGVGAGDVVGLIGDNRPDWVMGEIAAHAIGARSLGLYRDVLEDEVHYLLEFSGATVVLAEDEEQADKLLNVADRLPLLRHIIYGDPRGMRKYEDARLRPLSELLAEGAAAHAADPDEALAVRSRHEAGPGGVG